MDGCEQCKARLPVVTYAAPAPQPDAASEAGHPGGDGLSCPRCGEGPCDCSIPMRYFNPVPAPPAPEAPSRPGDGCPDCRARETAAAKAGALAARLAGYGHPETPTGGEAPRAESDATAVTAYRPGDGGEGAVLRIVFDSPPGHTAGRFVEVEDAYGRGVNAGEWREEPPYWVLYIRPNERALAAEREARVRAEAEVERLRGRVSLLRRAAHHAATEIEGQVRTNPYGWNHTSRAYWSQVAGVLRAALRGEGGSET